MRVKFTVGGDGFICEYENKLNYYDWLKGFDIKLFGENGVFIEDIKQYVHWIPYGFPFKHKILEEGEEI